MTRYLPILAVLVGCTSGETETSPKPAAEPEGPPPQVVPPRLPKPANRRDVDIYVDDVPVATISADQITHWPRIDPQLPPDATLDRWVAMTLVTTGDPIELSRPSSTYPGTAPVLFFGGDHTISFGMFDPKALTARAKPRYQADNVREIRIRIGAKPERSKAETAFARACTEPRKGEEHPPVGKGHWAGTAYQFNIDQYWTIDLTIDLSDAKIGDKVGSVIYHGYKCKGDLYRLPDDNGRRRVVEHFWHNENTMCVESCILEFACDGTSLLYRGYYPNGDYVAHATLKRLK